MLRTRIITAAILLTITLFALRHTSAWAVWMTLAMAAAGWEWGRMNGLRTVGSWATAAAVILLMLISARLGWMDLGLQTWGVSAQLYAPSATAAALAPIWWTAVVAWLIASVILLRGGSQVWQRLGVWPRWTGGVLALWVAALAAVHAHAQGVGFLLSALALVWMADISAYFCGRAFGQRLITRKLAPSISPGKTWEGALGGMAGTLALACLWVNLEAKWLSQASGLLAENAQNAASASTLLSLNWGMSIFSMILQNHGFGILILTVIWMTAMSISGDLVESLIKRSAGLKDSSQLLPGHGGVLDRIDAILPTLPIAMIFIA